MSTIDLKLPENEKLIVLKDGKRVVTATLVNEEEGWVEIPDFTILDTLPEVEFSGVNDDVLTEDATIEVPTKRLFGKISILKPKKESV